MPAAAEGIVNLPLFLVILGAGTLLSALLSRPIARKVGEPWVVVFGLGVSLCLVAAATLAPGPAGTHGTCVTAMVRPLGRGLWVQLESARALNTWLLVPIGFFVGYLAVRRWWILIVGLLVPLAVEGMQRFLPVLSRRCQYQDVIDNTWGLIIGAFVGVAVGALVAWLVRRSEPEA